MTANSNTRNSRDKIQDTDSSYLSSMICPIHDEPLTEHIYLVNTKVCPMDGCEYSKDLESEDW